MKRTSNITDWFTTSTKKDTSRTLQTSEIELQVIQPKLTNTPSSMSSEVEPLIDNPGFHANITTTIIESTITIEEISYRQHTQHSWLFFEEQFRNNQGMIDPLPRCKDSYKNGFRYRNWFCQICRDYDIREKKMAKNTKSYSNPQPRYFTKELFSKHESDKEHIFKTQETKKLAESKN